MLQIYKLSSVKPNCHNQNQTIIGKACLILITSWLNLQAHSSTVWSLSVWHTHLLHFYGFRILRKLTSRFFPFLHSLFDFSCYVPWVWFICLWYHFIGLVKSKMSNKWDIVKWLNIHPFGGKIYNLSPRHWFHFFWWKSIVFWSSRVSQRHESFVATANSLEVEPRWSRNWTYRFCS